MNVRFSLIRDATVEGIEVVVRAREKNDAVEALLAKLKAAVLEQSVYERVFLETYGFSVRRVMHLMRDGRYVTAKTEDGDHIIRDALVRVEERLDPAWFVRISQSEIVNLRYVKQWDFVGGGIIQIMLESGDACYTSRRYAAHIRQILLKGRAKQ